MQATILELNIYPIKGCAGLSLKSAELTATGLAHDRQWMVVDEHGEFLSQREHPRLALVRSAMRFENLVITAPGMLRLDLPVDVIEDAPETWRDVKVWHDTVRAVDEGDLCAQWFSDFLGTRARLVKFHPETTRACATADWGGAAAVTMFSDGYPILVIAQSSLEDLNRRLAEGGHAPVPMNRFRPNLVLGDLDPYGEDHVVSLRGDGLELGLIKPCTRCNVPNVDQASGTTSHQPGDTLAAYRASARMGGAITFGQNAIPVSGIGTTLRVGQTLTAEIGF